MIIFCPLYPGLFIARVQIMAVHYSKKILCLSKKIFLDCAVHSIPFTILILDSLVVKRKYAWPPQNVWGSITVNVTIWDEPVWAYYRWNFGQTAHLDSNQLYRDCVQYDQLVFNLTSFWMIIKQIAKIWSHQKLVFLPPCYINFLCGERAWYSRGSIRARNPGDPGLNLTYS